mgnify:CR=1 FL=1
MQNVTIYSTPTCHFCHMAKEYFKANNIAYTEHDVATDLERRKEMVEKSSQMGVPVIATLDWVGRGWSYFHHDDIRRKIIQGYRMDPEKCRKFALELSDLHNEQFKGVMERLF